MYNPQLETFLLAANEGSFSKAAEKAHISPTAVIKQINLLEASLEVKLFERTHRGLNLTKAGLSLYRDAEYIIQYSRDAAARAKNAMQEEINLIRIGTSPITPAQVLVALWPQIHAQCPDIKFQLVPFENTRENAREILKNLGRNIDLVAGIFDNTMLNLRQCEGLELSRQPLCCAVSIHHPLAAKNKLEIQDLYGENLLIMQRGWSRYVDKLRDDLQEHHRQICLIDFDFYDISIFNRCENSNDILLATESMANVHPLLKVLPVNWPHTIPFGLLHAPAPSAAVRRLLEAVKSVSVSKL